MKMKGQEKTERSKQHKAWRGRSQRWRPVRRHMIRRHDDVSWSHLTDCCSLKTQNKEPKAAVPLTSVSIHPLVKRITHRPCERWLVSHQSCFLSWPHEGNTQLEFSGDLSCVRVELRAASGLICVIKIIKINRCQVNSTRVKAWATENTRVYFPKSTQETDAKEKAKEDDVSGQICSCVTVVLVHSLHVFVIYTKQISELHFSATCCVSLPPSGGGVQRWGQAFWPSHEIT